MTDTQSDVVQRARAPRVLPVEIPPVGFKGPTSSDAEAFRTAARNIEKGYPVGGGNVTTAVLRLLRAAADALDASGEPDPPWSFYGYQEAAK